MLVTIMLVTIMVATTIIVTTIIVTTMVEYQPSKFSTGNPQNFFKIALKLAKQFPLVFSYQNVNKKTKSNKGTLVKKKQKNIILSNYMVRR